ncbi:alpha/beta hydrolase family esterase [Oceanobacillus polygoni]|uniref:Poly(Hydroxyalkanoate) depolymerase family esterase n=1 Tax=Oceanobacillus polygoni TaxID=1235259 RepID=A0A9X1CHK9_9BACI|nr:PHB depolymerase family esterase [Oceanobacillus polygoni]MBP2077983.1 poly(hydroxyalkanoate) depolymerase family esterase [Oceanobacillus polygoni]
MIQRIGMFLLVILVMSFSMYVPKGAEASGNLISGTYGGKDYKLYVPSNYDGTENYPLMVMLHGCTQDADQFIASTNMNALSEEGGFLVLYPEQNTAANYSRCWNWFEPAHQNRESGELSVLVGMVNMVKTDYMVNDDQVFVTGLSAGGAMSVLLAAAYPDVFSGVAVAAGLEYKAARSTVEAVMAMMNGGPNPVLQGRGAYEAMGAFAKPVPVIVFHGTSDFTVRPVNGDQVTTQWTVTNSLAASGTEDGWMDDIPDSVENDQVPNGKNYTVYDYHNEAGNPWVRKVIVEGMGHAWSGGSTEGTYVDSAGPDATTMIWDFFQSHFDDKPEP